MVIAAALYESEWTYFLKCVAEDRVPEIVPPSDSRAAVVACLAAEQSAANGNVVVLESDT